MTKELITKRLAENRTDRWEQIEIAKANTKAEAALRGATGNSRVSLIINDNIKAGLREYLDELAKFIHHAGGSSFLEYAPELLDEANKLKEQALATLDRANTLARAIPGNSERVASRKQLEAELDRIIAHKVEDFQLGIIEGIKMNPPPNAMHNTVNIIDSTISNAVLTIVQSGKDAQLKEVAQRISDLLKSPEVTNLPDEKRLEVLDHSENIVTELEKPEPDKGKVYRALKRLGTFLKSTGVEIASQVVAEISVAWAKSHGL